MKIPTKRRSTLLLTLFLLSNHFTAVSTAADSPGPKTRCFIEVCDPHISTFLQERRGIRAVKVDAESRCNFFQQNVRLLVRIYKKGRFSDHLVKEFETDPVNPQSSGFTVKNWQTYEICKNRKETIYYGTAFARAEINGKLRSTTLARSADSEPLKCGT
jgi:hypothetical protein